MRPEKRLEMLKERLGVDKVPIDIVGTDLGGWGVANVCRRILTNEIEETLLQRNGFRRVPFVFQQLFNFHYADGAKMLTFGGIFFREDQRNIFERCEFNQMEFVKTAFDAYSIDPPNLTFREIHFIDRRLPNRVGVLSLDGLPADDVKKYAKLYRYFPTFTETEI